MKKRTNKTVANAVGEPMVGDQLAAPPPSGPASGSRSCVTPRLVSGVMIPADHSFDAINEFVHNPDVSYEELRWAMLGMATERDALITEVAKWKANFIPFAAVNAGIYGMEHYGDGCLHFTHYDMLAEAGARMDDFKRCGDTSSENIKAE